MPLGFNALIVLEIRIIIINDNQWNNEYCTACIGTINMPDDRWCPAHRTSIEPVPTRLIGNDITILFYSLSTIVNFHYFLQRFHVHLLLIL